MVMREESSEPQWELRTPEVLLEWLPTKSCVWGNPRIRLADTESPQLPSLHTWQLAGSIHPLQGCCVHAREFCDLSWKSRNGSKDCSHGFVFIDLSSFVGEYMLLSRKPIKGSAFYRPRRSLSAPNRQQPQRMNRLPILPSVLTSPALFLRTRPSFPAICFYFSRLALLIP